MTSADIAFFGILAAFVAYGAARATGWEFSLSRFLGSRLVRGFYAILGATYVEKKVERRSTAWDFAA